MKLFDKTRGIIIIILLFLAGIISMSVLLFSFNKMYEATILILISTYALSCVYLDKGEK